jgi:hypothetical protein
MIDTIEVGDRFEDRYRIGEVLEIDEAGRCRVRWEVKREQRTWWIRKAQLLTHHRRIASNQHVELEHDLLPAAWASAGSRVAIEVLHTQRYDREADRLVPGFIVRVLVWADAWRQHWRSEIADSRGEALAACLEAAP